MPHDLRLEMIWALETHDLDAIERLFHAGLDPNSFWKERPMFDYFISMYMRSSRFAECVKLWKKNGLKECPILLSTLTDDAHTLEKYDSEILQKKRYTYRSSYTQFYEVSLMHFCAEYNLLESAKVLSAKGLSIDTPAGKDSFGLGGQTPIFHTVNQNFNASWEMLVWLLANGADPKYQVQAILWGKDFDWETLIPSVNPISYAMMGSLPQFQRSEMEVAKTVGYLMKSAYKTEIPFRNVPNKYLQD